MAGARIEIEVDDAAVLDVLRQTRAQLAPAATTELLGTLGKYLLGSTRDRAATESSPNGVPWAPLSPRYLKHKQRKRPNAPLLVFDFHLLGDRLAWQVDGNTLRVGTNTPYGARQQFGGDGISSRPWLGLSPEDRIEIKERTLAYLRDAMGAE